MKKLTAVLLLMILALGMYCGTGMTEAPEKGTAVSRLSDEVLMTYFNNTIFAGDSQIAKFRYFVKTKRAEIPDYFAGIDFRTVNNYKFRYATYRTLREPTGAHLSDDGMDQTLYYIVGKVKPEKLFMLAGLNDAFTTDYTMAMQEVDETGYDRAARYVREMTELVREASPETQIYIISQMPVTPEFVQGTNKGKAVQDRFDLVNETVRQECETLGIRYVDLAAGLKGEDGMLLPEYCGEQTVHLNSEGYEIFARELLDFAQAEYENGNWTPAAAETGDE